MVSYMESTNNNTWNMNVHIFKRCLLLPELIKSQELPTYRLVTLTMLVHLPHYY